MLSVNMSYINKLAFVKSWIYIRLVIVSVNQLFSFVLIDPCVAVGLQNYELDEF